MIGLHRCNESCHTLGNPWAKICGPNKTKDVNAAVFNIISGINEVKTLAKHISYNCKCQTVGRKCISNQKWMTIVLMWV